MKLGPFHGVIFTVLIVVDCRTDRRREAPISTDDVCRHAPPWISVYGAQVNGEKLGTAGVPVRLAAATITAPFAVR